MTDIAERLARAAEEQEATAAGCETVVPRWAAEHRGMAALLRDAAARIAALESRHAGIMGLITEAAEEWREPLAFDLLNSIAALEAEIARLNGRG